MEVLSIVEQGNNTNIFAHKSFCCRDDRIDNRERFLFAEKPVRVKVVDWGFCVLFSGDKGKTKRSKMDILLEQETNMNTIAALSSIAVNKTDNNYAAISRQVQTENGKVASDVDDIKAEISSDGAFDNLPPAEPVEIYFKDLSYSVQKMFSKS